MNILARQEPETRAVKYLRPETQATITIRQMDTRICLIDIQSELLPLSENVLMDAHTQASAAGAQIIILNFVGLEYMSSCSLSQLVVMLGQIRRRQQHLLVFGLNPHYRKIFEMTGLDQLIGLYNSEAEALAAVEVV
jgi:anti-anti-sigma factor